MSHGSLVVVEIFGPTIQGEGSLVGAPTVFVRLGGCDYRCFWCDSMHAVDKKQYGDSWRRMSADAVVAAVKLLTKSRPCIVTFSGGNPCLQDCTEVILRLKADGYKIAVETQGTVTPQWLSLVDYPIVSPKPPSSDMNANVTRNVRRIDRLTAGRMVTKIVVADSADLEFVDDWVAQFDPSLFPLYLSVCNLETSPNAPRATVADEIMDSYRWLIGAVLDRGYLDVRILPQLHVLTWGNKQGV